MSLVFLHHFAFVYHGISQQSISVILTLIPIRLTIEVLYCTSNKPNSIGTRISVSESVWKTEEPPAVFRTRNYPRWSISVRPHVTLAWYASVGLLCAIRKIGPSPTNQT